MTTLTEADRKLAAGIAPATHPLYPTWSSMKNRCRNSASPDYPTYGGRGIKVCDRWESSFYAFVADMGDRPPGHQLDRIDNTKGYCPENCRWATPAAQARNRRNTRLIDFNGKVMCLADWAVEFGLSPNVLGLRLRSGWALERALNEPLNPPVAQRWK